MWNLQAPGILLSDSDFYIYSNSSANGIPLVYLLNSAKILLHLGWRLTRKTLFGWPAAVELMGVGVGLFFISSRFINMGVSLSFCISTKQ